MQLAGPSSEGHHKLRGSALGADPTRHEFVRTTAFFSDVNEGKASIRGSMERGDVDPACAPGSGSESVEVIAVWNERADGASNQDLFAREADMKRFARGQRRSLRCRLVVPNSRFALETKRANRVTRVVVRRKYPSRLHLPFDDEEGHSAVNGGEADQWGARLVGRELGGRDVSEADRQRGDGVQVRVDSSGAPIPRQFQQVGPAAGEVAPAEHRVGLLHGSSDSGPHGRGGTSGEPENAATAQVRVHFVSSSRKACPRPCWAASSAFLFSRAADGARAKCRIACGKYRWGTIDQRRENGRKVFIRRRGNYRPLPTSA